MANVVISEPELKHAWYGKENLMLEKRVLFPVELVDTANNKTVYLGPYIKYKFDCVLADKNDYQDGVPDDNIFGHLVLDSSLYYDIQSACDNNTVINSEHPVEGNVAPFLIPYRIIFDELTKTKIHKSDVNVYKGKLLKVSGLFQFKLYFIKCIEDNTEKCFEPSHKKLWELHCKMINGILGPNV